MRVALYARVSTTYGQHTEMQLAELREYAGREGGKSPASMCMRVCRGRRSRDLP